MTLGRKILLLAAGIFLVFLVVNISNDSDKVSEPATIDPSTWFAPQWESLLGGDSPTPGSGSIDYNAINAATDMQPKDRAEVSNLAVSVSYASASGEGQKQFGTYFAKNHAEVVNTGSKIYCTEVSIKAVSPFLLPMSPSGSFVKVLVLWQGNCPKPPSPVAVDKNAPVYVSFIYLAKSDSLPRNTPNEGSIWAPVRLAELSKVSSWPRPRSAPLNSWELSEIKNCVSGKILARPEVVAAYEALCEESKRQGVSLMAIEGYRSPKYQQELYAKAVKEYGSERAARSKVAFSDGYSCESLHCAGEALDLRPDKKVVEWLSSTAACIYGDGSIYAPPCPKDATSIKMLERFGFIAPNREHLYHIEFSLGTLSVDAETYGDCTPGGVPVPNRVSLVFRCRALEAGLGLQEAERISKEAYLVAQCSSRFESGFASFEGRFRQTPNPSTGFTDDRVGIFGLSGEIAARWLMAGESLYSATANIDAAARIYVEERSWGRWGWDLFACATGSDGLTKPVIAR